MLKRLFSGPVRYNDTLIQSIGIPLIAFLSHYLTYDGSDSVWWFIYEIATDSFKIFLVWTTLKCVIYFLDRHSPWSGHMLRRLAAQLLLTCVAGMLMLTLTVAIDYALFRPYPMNHYSFDLVVALLFILLVNAIYMILYFHQSLRSTQENLEMVKKRKEEGRQLKSVWVKLGKKQIAVPFEKIAGFYSINKSTLLYTADGQSYPVDQSLDQLEKEPCTANMFRANRQYLISLTAVQSMQADAYGKINVYLNLSQPKDPVITVSREKAAAFRQWFRGYHLPVHP